MPSQITSPQPHQPGNAPGHNHVEHQGTFYFLDAAQLQRLNAAAIFEPMKEHLDLPARPVPVDHLGRLLQTFDW